MRRAVEIHLAEYADHQIALDRLNGPSDPVVSSAEMWSELGWDTPEPPC